MTLGRPIFQRVLGEMFYFSGGAMVGALLAFLMWFHWRILGVCVVVGALAINCMRLGHILRHGRPASATNLRPLHKALTDFLAPGALRMSRGARLGPLFGLGLTVCLIVVSEFGDGRPFTW